MNRSSKTTKENILDVTEALIYDHGFSGTSIDKVIEKAGITKGGFFYHFKSKNHLAKALIDRFSAKENDFLEDNMTRAEKLSSDPLQQLLIFVGLVEEALEGLEGPYPGCLFASFIYENALMDDEVMQVCSDTFTRWRNRLADKIREIFIKHPPRRVANPDTLADHSMAILEGAIILSKSYRDHKIIASHFRQYRNYLELLFET